MPLCGIESLPSHSDTRTVSLTSDHGLRSVARRLPNIEERNRFSKRRRSHGRVPERHRERRVTRELLDLRATLDGSRWRWMSQDPRQDEWDLIVGLRWDTDTRTIVGDDSRDAIDVVAERVLQVAA